MRVPVRSGLLFLGCVAAATMLAGCAGSASTPASSRSRPAPASRSKPSTSSSAASVRPTSSLRSSVPASTRQATRRGLPLPFRTGDARQVITVTAPSHASTTGTLQAWRRASTGWHPVGPSVLAHLGSDGISRHASESSSATPIGSFTLTQAFGHDADPGTALPYTHTTPASWWISQPGRLYNTMQRCSSGCSFNQGSPNEHLYYETPYYDYAVVIDYNTGNAPGGVHRGRGSAFFLHVTVGEPTQGCVSIPKGRLVTILRWLDPARHPRILLGVT